MNTNTNPKLENLTAHVHVELNSSHLTKEDYFFLLDVTKKDGMIDAGPTTIFVDNLPHTIIVNFTFLKSASDLYHLPKSLRNCISFAHSMGFDHIDFMENKNGNDKTNITATLPIYPGKRKQRFLFL